MGWLERRKNILSKLRNTFIETAKQNKVLDREKLASQICLEHGSSRRTALEYINLLLTSGFIEANFNNLKLADKKNVLKDLKRVDKVLDKAKQGGAADEK